MQDRAVVAAVVAGDEDGFAAAYDQYALVEPGNFTVTVVYKVKT